ncbi:MAG: hypothetical protein M3Y28_12195 [Armatimonadota bacterium]|nr:hypothetical protein [Armatimonadota bacterium]
MKMNRKGISLALMTSLAVSALSPMAFADSRQKNKNNWRNLAGAGAAVAGYGLLKGNKTATILGAAGAAYSANRYEKDRHSQSEAKANRARYHARQNYHRRTGRYLRHY